MGLFRRPPPPQQRRRFAAPLGPGQIEAAGGIASAEAFGTLGVTVGAVAITAAGAIATLEAFGTAVVARGLTAVGAIATAEAIGTQVVTAGAVSVTAVGAVATAEAHGMATLTRDVAAVGAIATVEAHGTALVTSAVTAVGAIATAEALGTVVVGRHVKAIGKIVTLEAFGSGGQWVAQVGTASTEYVEYIYDTASAPAAPRHVEQIISVWDEEYLTSGRWRLHLHDGTTDADAGFNYPITNSRKAAYASKPWATAPSTGAWTQAQLQAARLRWGYSNSSDIQIYPRLTGSMLEAEFRIAGITSGSTVFTCGAECRIPEMSEAQFGADWGHPGLSGQKFVVDTSVFDPDGGSASWRLPAVGTSSAMEKDFADVAYPKTIVARVRFRLSAAPDSSGVGWYVIALGGLGVSAVGIDATGLYVQTPDSATARGGSPSVGDWHTLDITVDQSANPWVTKASLDGGADVTQTYAHAAGTGWQGRVLFNWNAIGYGDFNVDNELLSSNSADYPLGRGYCLGYPVQATSGTHSFTGGKFVDHTGATITNGDSSGSFLAIPGDGPLNASPASVSPGAVALTDVGAIATAEAFGTTAVSAPSTSITAVGAVATAEAFGTTAVTAGSVSVADVGAIATAEVHGSSVLATGAVAITDVGAIATAESFGSTTITSGGVFVADVGGIVSVEVFGDTAVAVGSVTVTDVGAIASVEVFGDTTVASSSSLTEVGAIATAEAVGVPGLPVASDSFTESGSGDLALSSHTPEQGGTWTAITPNLYIDRTNDYLKAVSTYGEYYLSSPIVEDGDILWTHVGGHNLSLAFFRRIVGASQNRYQVYFNTDEADKTLTVERMTFNLTYVLSSITPTVDNAQAYRVRVRFSGRAPTYIKVRYWLATDPEPDTWDIETSDNTATNQTVPSSVVGIGVGRSSARSTALVDDFSVEIPPIAITPGAVEVSTVGAINSAEALGTPRIKFPIAAVGAIASEEAHGTAVVSGAASSVTDVGAIASLEVFGDTSVSPGAVSVTDVGAIGSLEVVGDPVLSSVYGLTDVGAIDTAEAFGETTLAATYSITDVGATASAEAFGQTVVTAGAVSITDVGAIATAEAHGATAVSAGAITITAVGDVASAETHGTTVVTSLYDLSNVGAVATAEAFGSTAVTVGALTLTNVGAIASAEAIDAPILIFGGTSVTDAGGIATLEAFGDTSLAVGGVSLTDVGAVASAEAFGPTVVSAANSVTSVGTIASVEALGNGAITVGAVSVTDVGAVATAEVVGEPQVSSGGYLVTDVGNVASAEAFGSASVITGGVTVTSVGAIPTAETHGATAVAVGGVTLTDVGNVASAEAFGSASVTVAGVTVAAAGNIASAEAFGTTSVDRGSVAITTVGAIASAEAFGTTAIGSFASITGVGAIVSLEAFGQAVVVPGVVTVSMSGIVSAEAFGMPSAAYGLTITGITSEEAFGTLDVSELTSLHPTGIPSAEAFGTLLVDAGQATISSVGAIGSVESFGIPEISYTLFGVGGIASAEAFGNPLVNWVRVIGRIMGTIDWAQPRMYASVQTPMQAEVQLVERMTATVE